MAKTKYELDEVEELSENSELFTYLQPTIEEAASKSRYKLTLNPIIREIQKVMDKNVPALGLIGRQFFFSDETKDLILKQLNVNEKQLLREYQDAKYFKQFRDSKLRDQLLFAIPLIMFSRELYLQGYKNEAQYIYFLTFLKPYATVVFKYFGQYGYEVNEDQMNYTIEKSLSNKFDIKKYSTVFSMLEKKAESSFNNFITKISNDLPLTDKDLHVIFQSDIYSRLNNSIKDVFGVYQKNNGKYLPFESSTFTSDEGEELMKDVRSDAAVKDAMIKKAVSRIIKNSIDENLIDVAAKYGFMNNAYSKYVHNDMIKGAVYQIVENKTREMPLLFEAIIGSFLTATNPNTGMRYDANDLRSSVFPITSKRLFSKSPNAKEIYTLKMRRLVESFLEESSSEYSKSKDKKRKSLEKAVHFYFVLYIQKG
jgi:hypothetical protein